MHAATVDEKKKAMTLKEVKKGYVGIFGGRKGKREMLLL